MVRLSVTVTEPSEFFSRRLTKVAAKTCLHLTPRVVKSAHSQVANFLASWTRYNPGPACDGTHHQPSRFRMVRVAASSMPRISLSSITTSLHQLVVYYQ